MSPLILDELLDCRDGVVDLFLRKARVGSEEKSIIHYAIGTQQTTWRDAMRIF